MCQMARGLFLNWKSETSFGYLFFVGGEYRFEEQVKKSSSGHGWYPQPTTRLDFWREKEGLSSCIIHLYPDDVNLLPPPRPSPFTHSFSSASHPKLYFHSNPTWTTHETAKILPEFSYAYSPRNFPWVSLKTFWTVTWLLHVFSPNRAIFVHHFSTPEGLDRYPRISYWRYVASRLRKPAKGHSETQYACRRKFVGGALRLVASTNQHAVVRNQKTSWGYITRNMIWLI